MIVCVTAGTYTLLTAGSITGAPTIGAGDSRLTYIAANTPTSIAFTVPAIVTRASPKASNHT